MVAAGPDEDVYQRIFAAMPTPLLVLSPSLVVVDANAAYIRVTGSDRRSLVGRDVFELFPSIPGTTGTAQLRASFERVRDQGQTDVLAALRYDIWVDGSYQTRYWNVTNTPVFDPNGEVVLLLNRVEDVTVLLEQQAAGAAAQAVNANLYARVAAAQADLLARAQELQELNARLRAAGEHDRTVARALQDAMLTRMPEPDHLHLVALYRTATVDDQVGGDWYDAVVLPSGATIVMIGDVVGHDIGAAAVMGQLRSMLRGFAWSVDGPPSEVMGLLDRAMRDLPIPALATAILGRIEQSPADAAAGRRVLRWTNAGHPPPVLLHADGATVVLDAEATDPLLGVTADAGRHDHKFAVPTDATLLLYTDGLIEKREGDLDEGLRRLRGLLTEYHHLGPAALLDAVVAGMVDGDHGDDVAVLAVRFNNEAQPRPAEPARLSAEAAPPRSPRLL